MVCPSLARQQRQQGEDSRVSSRAKGQRRELVNAPTKAADNVASVIFTARKTRPAWFRPRCRKRCRSLLRRYARLNTPQPSWSDSRLRWPRNFDDLSLPRKPSRGPVRQRVLQVDPQRVQPTCSRVDEHLLSSVYLGAIHQTFPGSNEDEQERYRSRMDKLAGLIASRSTSAATNSPKYPAGHRSHRSCRRLVSRMETVTCGPSASTTPAMSIPRIAATRLAHRQHCRRGFSCRVG